MTGSFGVGLGPNDDAVLDEEGGAGGEAEDAADAEGLGEFAFGIGEEGEGEIMFLLEFFLALRGIGADADDTYAEGLEVGEGITEGAGLSGAAWGIGFGVKIDEDDAFLVFVGEIEGVSVLVEEGEGWCG